MINDTFKKNKHLSASFNLFSLVKIGKQMTQHALLTKTICTSHLLKLCLMKPKYGYHPGPKKNVLIVDKDYESKAHAKYDHSGIKVVRGYCSLCGFIGHLEGCYQRCYQREGTFFL